MSERTAANGAMTRRIMPEAVLVCAVRLPALPAPSDAAQDVLALFRDEHPSRAPVIHILN